MSATKRSATDNDIQPSKKRRQEGSKYKDQDKHEKKPAASSNGVHESRLNNVNATNSREAHQKQKKLAKERKASKPNADSIQRSKQLWERLRRKSHVEKEERKKLVDELFEIITGHVYDYVFKHDSVRVVQCALKYANEAQRTMIAQELKGNFKSLVDSRYGKFLAAKLLVTGNDEVKGMIISEFYGHIRQKINHPEASWILDDTYRQVANKSQKASMLREWYGPEFAIFKAPPASQPNADLSAILADNPEKRKPILRYLYDLINQLVQKKMTGFTMLHDAMLQYSLAVGAPATSENATEFMELLKGELNEDEGGDLLKNLAYTKSGARVVCRALAYSNAKDRKILLRVYKDMMSDLASDANGMHIILAAYEVVDDTVMTSKMVISELLGSKLGTDEERYDMISRQANHLVARLPLLYPLAAGNAKWLIPSNTGTEDLVKDLRSLRVGTSKKDPEARRKELVRALSDKSIVLKTIEYRARQLVQSSFGCQFVTEVLLGCEGDKAAAMAAVADLAQGDPDAEGHIAHSSHAGKMLKTLSMGHKFDAVSAHEETKLVKAEHTAATASHRLGFAEVLYPRIKTHLLQWALSKNSFLIANYLDDDGFEDKRDIVNNLRKHRSELQQSSRKGNKGASLLLNQLQ